MGHYPNSYEKLDKMPRLSNWVQEIFKKFGIYDWNDQGSFRFYSNAEKRLPCYGPFLIETNLEDWAF